MSPRITPETAARIMRDFPVVFHPTLEKVTTYGGPRDEFWKIVDTYRRGLVRTKVQRMVFHKGYLQEADVTIGFAPSRKHDDTE
jgi:hypothetical protein